MKKFLLNGTSMLVLSMAIPAVTATAVQADDNLWTGGFVGIGAAGWMTTSPGEGGFGGDLDGYDNVVPHGSFYTEGNGDGGEDLFSGQGQITTVEVGYDQQSGSMVLGGFLSLDSAGVEATGSWDDEWFSDLCEGYCGDATVDAGVELGLTGTLGIRAGTLLTPNTLLYGTAGLSQATGTLFIGSTLEGFYEYEGEVDLSVRVPVDTANLSGESFGVGVEQMLQDNWSIKAEYRTTNWHLPDSYGEGGWEGWTEGTGFSENDGDTYGDMDGGIYIENLTSSSVRLLVTKRF